MCVWRAKCQPLERTPQDTGSHLSLVLVTGESEECTYFVSVCQGTYWSDHKSGQGTEETRESERWLQGRPATRSG